MLVRQQKQTGKTETQSFKIQMSKPILDEIDRALQKHYGFTDEELDVLDAWNRDPASYRLSCCTRIQSGEITIRIPSE